MAILHAEDELVRMCSPQQQETLAEALLATLWSIAKMTRGAGMV